MTQRRIRYFDANGVEVSEQTATRNGILQSGYALRVPTSLRDHAPRFSDGARSFWDQNRDRLLVVDARRIGGTEGNRPGYRVFDSDVGRAAKEAAYAEREAYLRDAWRDGATAGAYPFSAAAEGNQCTVDGRPGRLVKEGNALVCRPLAADAAKPRRDPEEDDDEDEDDDDMPQGEVEQMTSATDRRTIDQMSHDHQQRMAKMYAEHSLWLANQYKSKG